jgi:hypothetical protein
VNLTFEIEDAERDWSFEPNHFDFIHQRDLQQGIRDWTKFAKQCYTHVKPGGYVEWSAVYLWPQSDCSTIRTDAALLKLACALQKQAGKMGWQLDCPTRFKDLLGDAGFVGVEEYVFKIPCSNWPNNMIMNLAGEMERINLIDLHGAIGSVIYNCEEYLDQQLEDLENMVEELRKELVENKYNAYFQ